MRPEHVPYLRDPATGEPFKTEVGHKNGRHIVSGWLISASSRYPIKEGIPRLTLKAAGGDEAFQRHQEITADSFSYEWNNIYEENSFEKQNFLHFLSPFIKEEDLKGKKLLDAGCGSGRFTKQAALCQAEVVIGTDVGRSPLGAFHLTKDLPNVCIVEADLYQMPTPRFADLTFCLGVLHHLPRPQDGFKSLTGTVRPGGKYLIWVYNRRHNFRAVYIFETLRLATRHIPRPLLFKLCYAPGAAVHGINRLTRLCDRLGAKKLARKIPFSYYANFPFSMKLNDAFDVLATPKSNYYYVEEIQRWFREAGLNDSQFYEHPEAGITAAGTISTSVE